MKKRVVSLVLAAVLVAGLVLTGCGSKSETSSNGDSEGEVVSDLGVYPVVEEQLDLSVFVMKASTIEDLDTNLFTQELEELTNIHVNWEISTEDAIEQKLNILFTGGDYPDVLLGTEISQQEQMVYGTEGVLIPLNDLIEEHTVYLKELFEEIDWLEAAVTAPDGNIYSLPMINECYHCTMPQKLWINQTWLDNLGLEMPTTTEEFEAVLLAFKNDDPNQNGINDEIPFSGNITGWNTGLEDSILNAFIYNDGTADSYRTLVEDGEVIFAPAQDAYRDGLTWLASLYEQGLIDEAAFTQPGDQQKQLAMGDDALIGVAAAGSTSGFTTLGSDRMNEYVAVPPLTGPDGVCTTAYAPVGITQGAFSITSANEDPIATIKWIDYVYSEEGSMRAMEGREGEEWAVPEDGALGINGEQAEWTRLTSFDDVQNVVWQGISIGAVTEDYRLSELAGEVGTTEGFEKFMYEETYNKYESVDKSSYMPSIFILEEYIDSMALIKGPLIDYVEQSAAKFITGAEDIETGWDAYIENLESLKYEEYVDILQDSYEQSLFYEE